MGSVPTMKDTIQTFGRLALAARITQSDGAPDRPCGNFDMPAAASPRLSDLALSFSRRARSHRTLAPPMTTLRRRCPPESLLHTPHLPRPQRFRLHARIRRPESAAIMARARRLRPGG